MNLTEIKICDENCPVRRSLQVLSGKWTLMILYQINDQIVRYGELKRKIPGISEKMLIQELNHLIEHNMVHKRSFPQIPPKVEYSLTHKGLSTLPIADQLATFAIDHLQ